MTTGMRWLAQHWPELSAALTALVCIWLTVKNKIANWPWGIVSVLLYSWVFWQGKLYASFGLNLLYFFPCCIYGWWYWAKCGPKRDDDLPVRHLSARGNLLWLGITIALSLLIGAPIAYYTQDPTPYMDSLVTGMSIVAQWMQAKKWIENWWYWIALDAVSAFYLFPSQKLYFSAVLYVIFLIVAVRGVVEWRRLLAVETANA